MKIGRPRDAEARRSLPELGIPVFGYKSHIAIHWRFGLSLSFAVTDAARHDGSLLRELVTTNNIASDIGADTAYRLKANEAWLAIRGRVFRIHPRKPRG